MSTHATIHLLSHAVGVRSPHGLSWGPQWALDLVEALTRPTDPQSPRDGRVGSLPIRVSSDATLWALVTDLPDGALTTLWLEEEDALLFAASLAAAEPPPSGRTTPTG